MSFKSRVLRASVFLVWAPLLVLALATRREMTERLTEEHRRRVETLLLIIEADIEEETRRIHARLSDLRTGIENDNRFRLEVTEGETGERGYLLDYAGRAMKLTGLSMLQVQDETGRILSSGHFRNEYDRMDPGLPRELSSIPGGAALVEARLPDGSFLVLSAVESFQLGQKTFTLVGGVAVEERFLSALSRDSTMSVTLIHPRGAISSRPDVPGRFVAPANVPPKDFTDVFADTEFLVDATEIPLVGSSRDTAVSSATLVAAYPRAPLKRILRSLDLWLLVVFLGSIFGTLFLARWVSSRVSRPIEELAQKTLTLDLDRLDTDFTSTRNDEIGELSRFLGAMTQRLKAGARKLRAAERNAAVGELARQINHDVRNGLIPIRNVFRHLSQVSQEDPEKLREVFEERRKVLDSSMEYLEELAGHYSRLYSQAPKERCDLNQVVSNVVAGWEGTSGLGFEVRLGHTLPGVFSAPIALHRILENLIANAAECMSNAPGTITVITETGDGHNGEQIVRLIVTDTGPGISPEDKKHVFDDFFTTKNGAGLGLSIVRRMVGDVNGVIEVESEPGKGARFIVEIPAAEGGAGTPSLGGEGSGS